MYKATVNQKHIFNIDAISDVAIKHLGGNRYEITRNGISELALLKEYDDSIKQFTFLINHITYVVSLKNDKDKLLEKIGINTAAKAVAPNLKSPMPGLIKEVLVKPGDLAQQGTPLLVLEAMKMENVLKCEGDDITIGAIDVAAGDNVEKNQILIHFQ